MKQGILFTTAMVLLLWGIGIFSGKAEASNSTVILNLSGHWRAFYVLKGPYVRNGDKLEQRGAEVDTDLPPEDWKNPEFDDHTWHHLRGRPFPTRIWRGLMTEANAGFTYADGTSAFQSLICLRGKFNVTDPGKVKDLMLSVEYRGGVVVYLNGKEISRGHMPEGKIDMDTFAQDYPIDVFLNTDGKLQHGERREKNKEVAKKWCEIKRSITDVKVPPEYVAKGVNVLAVQVHRSTYNKEFEDKITRMRRATAYLRSTCGITDLILKSPDGNGIEPNHARPEGMQVWNSPLLEERPHDFGDPLEPLRPVFIPACRNGRFSGKVSVGSRNPIKKLGANITDLKDAKTRAIIPASSIVIRYNTSETPPEEVVPKKLKRYYYHPPIPAEVRGAVQPILITVSVTKDANPGDYEGKLTITAEGGGPFEVPVKVSVADFTLPDPKDYETFVDIIQSPKTLAMHYDAELWSEEHWKLIDHSFKILGTIGLDTVYIPMMAETHFGNEQSMVRWIKKGENTYEYDFSIMERYLDTYEKHCGKPRIICLYVWDICLEGGSSWVNKTGSVMNEEVINIRKERAKLGLGPEVTGYDPTTRKTELIQLPQYSEQGSLELWKPLYDKFREIMEERELLDKVMLGIPLDPKPTKGVVDLFKQVMPGTPWLVQDHIYRKAEKIHGVPVVYQANVFLHGLKYNDVRKSRYGMKHPEIRLQFPRGLTLRNSMSTFRIFAEKLIIIGLQGFARVGGDLWPIQGKRSKKYQLTVRYPKSSAGGLSVWTHLLVPGPDRAAAPPKFEMLREGVQETEARIFVERTLQQGKITGKLAEQCREMLTNRNRAVLIGANGKINTPHKRKWWGSGGARPGHLWYLASGYNARAQELFALAAKVQRRISGSGRGGHAASVPPAGKNCGEIVGEGVQYGRRENM